MGCVTMAPGISTPCSRRSSSRSPRASNARRAPSPACRLQEVSRCFWRRPWRLFLRIPRSRPSTISSSMRRSESVHRAACCPCELLIGAPRAACRFLSACRSGDPARADRRARSRISGGRASGSCRRGRRGAAGGNLSPSESRTDGAGLAVPTATGIAFHAGNPCAVWTAHSPLFARVHRCLRGHRRYSFGAHARNLLSARIFISAWLGAVAAALAILYALNRWRVYAAWPYVVSTIGLWIFLHLSGVHAALAGIFLAVLLPTRPTPDAGPLLAQAATALATLEHAQTAVSKAGSKKPGFDIEAVWDWAGRNLLAVSDRLLSPAERIEQSVAPWTAYLALPLFAFSTSGVSLSLDMSSPDTARVLAGVVLGLLAGKPAGVLSGVVSGGQVAHRHRAEGHRSAQLCRRRVSLRGRRYAFLPDGGPGIPARSGRRHGKDRRARRLGPCRRPWCSDTRHENGCDGRDEEDSN